MATKLLMLLGVIFLISAAAILPLRLHLASAHGETRLIVTDVESGPYVFRVGILPGSPRVGTLHLSVLIQPVAGDATISDGQVVVMATGPEAGMTAGPVSATNTPQNPQLFEANIDLTALGSWTMTLETTSELGQTILEVPLEVTEAGGFNLLLAIFIFALVLIIVSLGWSQLQRRKKPA
ncbi:MAG: hypothetical protein O2913_11280 [Chloroflexi bacterium]|nr:hypothetical protein [Chloroflexota bacterium]